MTYEIGTPIEALNGTMSFDGKFVTITRTGLRARASVGKGEKRIPIRSISAVQWKPPSKLVRGYLQLTVPGGNEVRSRAGMAAQDAAKDENSVLLAGKHHDAFLALRTAIEDAIAASD